ncbi:MAG TPA: DegT/DnrJ/EryC1/StrS family aminotransferase [Dehalococcoidales bacterium]|nr:DegT/DnrJ/EryC1/StrS family aminotransferase [Dehalococcoidales bacterium]
MNIPLARPFLGEEEKEAVVRVIESRRLAMGDTVRQLETALARKFKRSYCAAVSSGSAALYLAIRALGVKRVIIPALTCDAVLHSVVNAGAAVIFADVDRETHNLDPATVPLEHLDAADAIIVTHTYGHPADMEKVEHYVKKYRLTLIEDFAQATGGYFRDKAAGGFGRVSVTSFYGAKVLAAGHGGAILTDDEELYHKCVYGRGSRADRYYRDIIPFNLQMTDLQAAIGLVQLAKLDRMVEMRTRVAGWYDRGFGASPVGLTLQHPWAKPARYKYAIILPENVSKSDFIERMKESGIDVGRLYDPPLHRTERALKIPDNKVNLPVAEELASRTVSLPMYPELTSTDVEKICREVTTTIGVLGANE